ncbi:hypothetical protein FBU59_005976, partial [Linderina macrospora]
MSIDASAKKLRVLCLHGYEQDATVFRVKIKHLVSEMAGHVDFVFATAPNILRPFDYSGMDSLAQQSLIQSGNTISRVRRGWYTQLSATPEIVQGLENSIAYLQGMLEELGPFDGIFGFSQGALMAAVMCSLIENNVYTGHPPFKFGVFASGYKLNDEKWSWVYDKPLKTPSLHVYGVVDSMIHI